MPLSDEVGAVSSTTSTGHGALYRDLCDQRAYASVSCVHADRDNIRVHHPSVPQDFGSGITFRNRGANPRAST